MEIDHLREFITFSDSLNYSATAREMFIAQSTLSKHIANLEGELGVELVASSSKPRLTPIGQVFVPYAKTIVREFDGFRAVCERIRKREGLQIKMPDIMVSLPIAKQLASVFEERGGESVSIVPVGDPAIFDQDEFQVLDEGLVDVSFTFAPDNQSDPFSQDLKKRYDFLALPPEEMVFLVAADHPLARKSTLTPQQLSQLKLLLVKTPFWQRCEESCRILLESTGLTFSFYSGGAAAKVNIPSLDHNFAAISYETPAIHIQSLQPQAFSIMRIEGTGLAIRPYAIWRKDSRNEAVHELMAAWRKSLEG